MVAAERTIEDESVSFFSLVIGDLQR